MGGGVGRTGHASLSQSAVQPQDNPWEGLDDDDGGAGDKDGREEEVLLQPLNPQLATQAVPRHEPRRQQQQQQQQLLLAGSTAPPPFSFARQLGAPAPPERYPGRGRADDNPFVSFEEEEEDQIVELVPSPPQTPQAPPEPRHPAVTQEQPLAPAPAPEPAGASASQAAPRRLTEAEAHVVSLLQDMFPGLALLASEVAAANEFDFQRSEEAMQNMNTETAAPPVKFELDEREKEIIAADQELELREKAKQLREVFPEQSHLIADILASFDNNVDRAFDMLVEFTQGSYDFSDEDESYEGESPEWSGEEDGEPGLEHVADERADRHAEALTRRAVGAGADADSADEDPWPQSPAAGSAGPSDSFGFATRLESEGEAVEQLARMFPGVDREQLKFCLEAGGGDVQEARQLLEASGVTAASAARPGPTEDTRVTLLQLLEMYPDKDRATLDHLLEAAGGDMTVAMDLIELEETQGTPGAPTDGEQTEDEAVQHQLAAAAAMNGISDGKLRRLVQSLRHRFPSVSEAVRAIVLEDCNMDLQLATQTLGRQTGQPVPLGPTPEEAYRPLNNNAARARLPAQPAAQPAARVRLPSTQSQRQPRARAARATGGSSVAAVDVVEDFTHTHGERLAPGTHVPARVRAAANSQTFGDMSRDGALMVPREAGSASMRRQAARARSGGVDTNVSHRRHYGRRDELMAQRRNLLNQRMYEQAPAARAAATQQLRQVEAALQSVTRRARRSVFRDHNAGMDSIVRDLHGIDAQGALDAVDQTLAATAVLASQKAMEVTFIVGKGLHSAGGVAVIKSAVLDFLRRHNITHEVDPANQGQVRVCVPPSYKRKRHEPGAGPRHSSLTVGPAPPGPGGRPTA